MYLVPRPASGFREHTSLNRDTWHVHLYVFFIYLIMLFQPQMYRVALNDGNYNVNF
jgi:hypothetical protein